MLANRRGRNLGDGQRDKVLMLEIDELIVVIVIVVFGTLGCRDGMLTTMDQRSMQR